MYGDVRELGVGIAILIVIQVTNLSVLVLYMLSWVRERSDCDMCSDPRTGPGL